MQSYNPADIFSDSGIYALSDLVQGGLGGDANDPLQALFDRTLYLLNRSNSYDSIKTITGDYAFDVVDIRKLLFFQINANKVFTLPDVSTLRAGTRIPIKTAITGIKNLTVQAQGTQLILDGTISFGKYTDASQPATYMHDGEFLVLVAAGTFWMMETAIGNFHTAGESYSDRIQAKNTLVANGDPYQRADIPRVTIYAARLAGNGGIVPDAQWFLLPGGLPYYKGCYSFGNGTTTIRVPDERGVAIRNLDLGRGIDANRLYNSPGGFENDANGPHSHLLTVPAAATSQGQNGQGRFVGGGEQNEPSDMIPVQTSNNTGTDQTIMKNIGKIPLIRY